MESQGTEEKTLVHKDDEPLHFYVEGKTAGDPVVALRWCICPEISDKLKEVMADPYLLISILVPTKHDTWRETERKLVPLKRAMEYVYFQGAGPHRILGTIVWPLDEVHKTRKYFLSQKAGEYETQIVSHYDTEPHFILSSYAANYGWIDKETSLKIYVAKEYFAKEPPQWLKSWVNLWFETKPRDQCSFRRRCILAFTLQPILIFLWIIINLLIKIGAVVICLLLTMRSIGFKSLMHPIVGMPIDVWKNCNSAILRDKHGNLRSAPIMLSLFPLSPAFICFMLLICFAGAHHHGVNNYLFPSLIKTSFIAATLSALLFIVAIIVKAIIEAKRAKNPDGYWYKKFKGKEAKRKAKIAVKKEKERLAFIRVYDRNISPLVCTGMPVKANLGALPPEKVTLHLRYMDLKTKVCKPFSQY